MSKSGDAVLVRDARCSKCVAPNTDNAFDRALVLLFFHHVVREDVRTVSGADR